MILDVEEPPGGFVNTRTFRVAGRVEDALTEVDLLVQGMATDLVDGAFETEISLADGPFVIGIEATDEAGNTSVATIELEIFVSPPLTFVSETDPNGGRIELDEGALRRPDLTVVVRDVPHADIQGSLGAAADHILAALPSDLPPDVILPADAIIIPGAMAMTFDGPDLTDAPVNGTPRFSVPAIPESGVDPSMPMWILQLVPDSTGDGVPELKLASLARMSDDGTRVLPIPPGPDSPFPGFQFGPEFAFDETTIGQVQGLEHASVTYIACCCSAAFVPIEGETECEPSDIAKRQIELAERLLADKQAIARKMARINEELDRVFSDELLPALAVFVVKGSAATLAIAEAAPAIAEIVTGLRGASSIAEVLAILGSGSAVGLMAPGDDGTPKIVSLVNSVVDVFSSITDGVNRALDKIIAGLIDIESLKAQAEHHNLHIQAALELAHEFSGCSRELEDAAELAGSVAEELATLTPSITSALDNATALRAAFMSFPTIREDLEQVSSALTPLIARAQNGTATDDDVPAFQAEFSQLGLTLPLAVAQFRESARLNNSIRPLVDRALRSSGQASALLEMELERIGSIENKDFSL
ncbi:MAG TPA: hypothetical protein VK116_02340, partial [Planctomycetota bacterium]|nr:hypothetical protein [Planctomycetota bacterium]